MAHTPFSHSTVDKIIIGIGLVVMVPIAIVTVLAEFKLLPQALFEPAQSRVVAQFVKTHGCEMANMQQGVPTLFRCKGLVGSAYLTQEQLPAAAMQAAQHSR